jgi:hypothetical protein
VISKRRLKAGNPLLLQQERETAKGITSAGAEGAIHVQVPGANEFFNGDGAQAL